MTTLKDLSQDRRRLILHRITRAVAEKLQREDVMALYSFLYMEATLHRAYREQLGPEELKASIEVNSDMLVQLMRHIQHKRRFDFGKIVMEIISEEGVTQSDETDNTNIFLAFITEAMQS